ncbi:sensor domain-containing diguanylate cyclase [Litchfieldella xinjiangensis]|uniref:sensor domain-containing diguanylate cyclase n=1 Tax=Litchfieldella xinjiangensis TaxID=1166948 RepID=UPI0005BA8F78|nr:diguanylate cyclase [Halomonas xinjiangensis]
MGWLLRSLHSRLLLGISLGWLLLVAAVLLYASQSGSSLVRQANIAHLEYEASLIAQDLGQAVDERIAALSRLAVQADPTAEDRVDQLSSNASLLEFFDLLVMVSAEGEVVADWPQLEGRAGLDVSHRAYFRFISQVRRPYVSEPFEGGASGEPLVMIGVPVFDEQGNFAGMLGGVVNVRSGSFFSDLRRIRIGDAGYAALASVSGHILSHPNEALIMAPTPSAEANPFIDLALSGWEGSTDEGQLLSGESALQAFRQIWSAGWVVGVFLPRSQVQGPIRGFVNELWWVGLMTVGLMLPLLWWLLHALLKPLRSLERQIGRTASGEASRVHLYTGMRELQEVAEAFNRAQDRRGEAVAMLKDRQAFLDAVLASSPVGMFVCNLKGEIEYLNPALSELTGYGLSDYRDNALLNHIHPDDLNDTLDLWRDTLRTGRDFQRQFRYIAASGDILWVEVHISQVHSVGVTLGYVGTVKDITQRREQEALQRWEAEHDPLTGLLNRRGFERRLDEAMAEWQKTGSPSALILIDLDNFKPINDEGGHALGDEMLRRIAQVIAWEVRRSDHVARQGGDEFAVLMPSCTLPHAEKVAKTLQHAVREICVSHVDKEYRVSLSIGIAGFEESDKAIDSLLARADDACYEAKAQGRDKVILANVTH